MQHVDPSHVRRVCLEQPDLAGALRRARRARGLSQQAAADQLSSPDLPVSQQTLSNWETGTAIQYQRLPLLLERLAEFLQLTAEETLLRVSRNRRR